MIDRRIARAQLRLNEVQVQHRACKAKRMRLTVARATQLVLGGSEAMVLTRASGRVPGSEWRWAVHRRTTSHALKP